MSKRGKGLKESKVAELRLLCLEKGLNHRGTKEELLERLQDKGNKKRDADMDSSVVHSNKTAKPSIENCVTIINDSEIPLSPWSLMMQWSTAEMAAKKSYCCTGCDQPAPGQRVIVKLTEVGRVPSFSSTNLFSF